MMATKKFYLEAVRGRLIALKSRSETAKLKKNYFQSWSSFIFDSLSQNAQ